MPNPFAITAATNTIRLDDKRQAETSFTAFNNSGRQIRGRARIVPLNPASEKWLNLVGEAEKDFPIAGTQEFKVGITVPPDAPAGTYPFRLDVFGVDNPDEELSQGPNVLFEVPAPVAQNQAFPIWIPLVIVGAVLLVGGVIAFLLLRDGNNNTTSGATATPTTPASGNSRTVTFDGVSPGVLAGEEFVAQGLIVGAVPRAPGSYCEEASVAAVLPAGTYVGTSRPFLTSATPDNAQRCNTVPVSIAFTNPVKKVTLAFAGAEADYEMYAFDEAGSEVGRAQQRGTLGEISKVSLDSPGGEISLVTFGKDTAVTAIIEVFFSW